MSADLMGGLVGSVESSKVLRNHMQADMMHDALRADVVAALLATHGGEGTSIADVKGDLTEHVKIFRQSIADNNALATDPAMRSALGGVESQLAIYIDAAQAIVALAETNPLAAQAKLAGFQGTFKALEAAMDTAGDAIEGRAERTAKGVIDHARLGEISMSALLVAALLLSAAVVLLAQRIIVKPIRELTADMGALASGRTDIMIRGAKRTDEIGEIGRAVRAFQDVIVHNMRAEADLATERRVQEAEAVARAASERAEAGAAQARIVQAIATGLDRQSQGDLAYRLTDSFPMAYEKLRIDFNSAMESLQAAMQTIADGVQAFQLGSEQISSASDDLARRTEKQAASLEETAAALGQITATVETTSRGSIQARQVVSDAKSGAEHSGEVVRQAIAAMGEIERSSREVGNIIGVIEEIVFQTNLLALNAGVEAARAGDAGRGFAVVASEVRALAQRSAEAAKEIKTLVLASNQQVARGVHLVGDTGRALETIVAQVTQINTVVSDIATRTQEQAVALQEVNTAITQMDQVTQQNAAMVEQTTAASHSMVREAENLANSVDRFRGGQASRSDGPTRSKTSSGEPARREVHPQTPRATTRRSSPVLKVVESHDASNRKEF